MSDWPRRIIFRLAIMALLLIGGCGVGGSQTSKPSKISSEPLERMTEKGPVKLLVKITPREPRLSDLVEMIVEVTAPPEVEIKPPEFGQAVGEFLVRDYTEQKESRPTKSTAESNASSTRRFRYQLEPKYAGRHLIRSIEIQFIDRRPVPEATGKPTMIESEPIEVHVTSEFGDQVPSLANLEPMLHPQPIEDSSGWTWIYIAVIVVVSTLAWFWIRHRQRSAAPQERKLTPEEIAHAALSALLAENLPQKGLIKEFYLRLTGIVRYYIEGTTGLRAPEQTTEEFLRAMRLENVFPAERSARLAEFLEAADMVKYAGQQPDENQIDMSIARAREFVDLRPTALATPNVTMVGA